MVANEDEDWFRNWRKVAWKSFDLQVLVKEGRDAKEERRSRKFHCEKKVCLEFRTFLVVQSILFSYLFGFRQNEFYDLLSR
jgi:hypothetical protein